MYHSSVAECERKKHQFSEGTKVRREESRIHHLLVSLSHAQVVVQFAVPVVYIKTPLYGVNH